MNKRLIAIAVLLFLIGGFLLAWTSLPPSIGVTVAVAGVILIACHFARLKQRCDTANQT